MTENSRVAYFHVGLPKTASTFLQRRVFPYFQDITYVKKHDFKRHEKVIESNNTQHVLLSVEFTPHPGNKSSEEKIGKVRENFSTVYPIIVLRKHSSWLRSKYKYYIRKHGKSSFDQFIDPQTATGREIRMNLDFYTKIKHLERSFGHRPLVLFQEELKKAPLDTIRIIAGYVNVSYDETRIQLSTVKKSYSEHQLKWVRKFNRFYVYQPQKIKITFLKKLYKKISQLFLHTVAYTANFLPEAEPDSAFIPNQELKQIDEEYHDDWNKCIAYARETRQLLL
ncbi:MAG: hypothetical protein K9J27_00895 [Bacteroidales bacterium]|nr:hypothetical protein [Bacteroidales bacterium]MCF8332520.1 hypothetical protein [Bacteroidales bacterium]